MVEACPEVEAMAADSRLQFESLLGEVCNESMDSVQSLSTTAPATDCLDPTLMSDILECSAKVVDANLLQTGTVDMICRFGRIAIIA